MRMIYTSLPTIFDIERIKTEITQIVCQVGWYQDSQISLQSPNGDFMLGTGWVGDLDEKDFKAENLPNDYELSRFIETFGLFHTRIMKLKPKVVYTAHTDRTPRIHLPIVTNEYCRMVINDVIFHLPTSGHAYYTETTLPHTAFNAGLTERIHIVGCVDLDFINSFNI